MTAETTINIVDMAATVLRNSCPNEKILHAKLCLQHIENAENITFSSSTALAIRPPRPSRPQLISPTKVPKRKLSTQEGRAALLHAIAHIEFNAIDLAFDMAARFACEINNSGLEANEFVIDWIKIGADEARHFSLVQERLSQLDSGYGKLPAHDGLWDAAEATCDTVLARLAVAPLVLEARGLDVTPGMIKKLQNVDDKPSADILQIIYDDEVGHVATGMKWFKKMCNFNELDPESTFKALVAERFTGTLRPPFNASARDAAGIPQSFYV